MYKMINEELRIAACRINEIPRELVEEIKPLETLTMYYDPSCDIVVVNQDNVNYELYKKLCIVYLDASYSVRSKLKCKFKSLDTLGCVKLLDDIIDLRERKRLEEEYRELDKILGKADIGIIKDNLSMINTIGRNRTDFWRDPNIFMYGYIMGKRAERARRKRNITV